MSIICTQDEVSVTSVGNTRLPVHFDALVDWLQLIVTLPFAAVETLIESFADLLAEPGTVERCLGRQFGCTAYPYGAITLNKQRFAWADAGTDGFCKLWISIPSTALNRIPNYDFILGLSRLISAYEYRVSRVDFAIDDYTKSLTTDDFDSAHMSGNIVGNPSYKKTEKFKRGIRNGFTRYVGSRSSKKMCRFYDKFAESKGKIDSYRLEVEFKDELGHRYFEDLLAICETCNSEAMAAFIVESVIGAVRFTEGDNVKSCRRPVAGWWQSFTDLCQSRGGFRIAQHRRETTLTKTVAYLEKIKGTFAFAKQGLGAERYNQLMSKWESDGRSHMSRQKVKALSLLNRGFDKFSANKPILKSS